MFKDAINFVKNKKGLQIKGFIKNIVTLYIKCGGKVLI